MYVYNVNGKTIIQYTEHKLRILNLIEKQNVLLDYCTHIREKTNQVASDLCYDMNIFNDSPEQRKHTV